MGIRWVKEVRGRSSEGLERMEGGTAEVLIERQLLV